DIIIRGGENVSAVEVEELLARLPGVAEVAVVSAPDARLGEHGCAFVRPQPGAPPLGLAAVRAHLEAAGLARPKWPEELRLVDELPRTPSGKGRSSLCGRGCGPRPRPKRARAEAERGEAMDFEFTDEQQALRASVRSVLERHCPIALVRDVVEKGASVGPLWEQMVALDWQALTVPADAGGL